MNIWTKEFGDLMFMGVCTQTFSSKFIYFKQQLGSSGQKCPFKLSPHRLPQSCPHERKHKHFPPTLVGMFLNTSIHTSDHRRGFVAQCVGVGQ